MNSTEEIVKMDFIIDTVGSTGNGEQLKPSSAFSSLDTPNKSMEEKKESTSHPLAHLFEIEEKEKTAHPLSHLFEIEEINPPKPKETRKISLAEKLSMEGLSRRMKKNLATVTDHEKRKQDIDKLLAKSSVLSPEFEKQYSIGNLNASDKKLREQRRKEREKTKGSKWYGLPATEMTDEVKRELELLQMRSVLDPKHFYKKNDSKVLPKYFQIGKVLDSPLDFYNNRLTKKERKKGLVEELLADAQFNKYNKMKYSEIITEKQKTHYKAWREAKKLKKNKK